MDRLHTVWRKIEKKANENARWHICQERATWLIEDLQSEKPGERLATAKLFGKLGIRATGHPIQALATLSAADPDGSVRKAANDAVIQILSSVLTDDYPAPDLLEGMRRSAAQGLQKGSAIARIVEEGRIARQFGARGEWGVTTLVPAPKASITRKTLPSRRPG